MAEDLLGRADVLLPQGSPGRVQINTMEIFGRDMQKQLSFLARTQRTAIVMDGITDKSGQKEPDLLHAVVQDKLHKSVDISIQKEIPCLGDHGHMHPDPRPRPKLEGTDRAIEAPLLAPDFVMNLGPVIIETQIDLV